MQFWGDIVLHKPELIPELPKDVIALNWVTTSIIPLKKKPRLRQRRVPFYVCPARRAGSPSPVEPTMPSPTSNPPPSTDSPTAPIGYLNTDWGDLGHLQYLPISFLGFAAGAAYSWCFESNKDLNLADALNVHVFRDTRHVMGQLMQDFGNVYQAVKTPMGMSTRLFWSLVGGEDRRKLWG
jgi:hypothetical protein